ncbi:MAG: polysaccharide deacetylase family protein [Clostridia bacterium]|nr:polysaccharide deacetylase family protein [Clostridia bacterium]
MKFAVVTKKDVSLIVIMIIWIIVLVSVVSATLYTSVASQNRRIPIYSVDKNVKEIAFTFNCAWESKNLYNLLSLLEEENMKCTFFFVGDFAEKYPEAVRMIYNYGHEIGNHSMKHTDPVKQEYSDIVSDINACNELLYYLTGCSPTLYRAPSGSYDNKTIEASESLGMKTIQWDVDSIDWKDPSPEKIKSRVTSKVTNGSIVLFHLGKDNTLEALPDIIDALKAQDYSFVTVGELLLTGETYVDNNGRQKEK